MAKGRDSNFVSVWFWLFAVFVMAIPIVNIIMTIVWAFAGDNESRKNYFKALIVMFFLVVGFWVLLMSAGMAPEILNKFGMLPK